MNETDPFLDIYETLIQTLNHDALFNITVSVNVLRLDKIHATVSGNKWFKLKYHLQEARDKRFDTVLTFGGAWSNHIVATACAAKILGFRSIGVVRGEKPKLLSKTLADAKGYGMELEFVSRENYSKKTEADFANMLTGKYGRNYVIPEGGAGKLGVKGSAEILSLVPELENYSHIVCCIGTGTMFAGIAESALPHQTVIGIPVLKGAGFHTLQLETDNPGQKVLKIIGDYHFGGYAKKNAELINFMNDFYRQSAIPADFVYTGKLFFGLMDLIGKQYFQPGSKILAIHSGGLQGNASLPPGILGF